MKKLFLSFVIVLISLFITACAKNDDANRVVLLVNGEEVTRLEQEYFEGKRKSEIMSKYIKEYGATVDEKFWETSFNGVTPQEKLDELVLQDTVKAKLQLVLCRDYEIYSNISFDALYNKALQYNEENKDIKTVGVQEIPLESFYDYYVDNGVMELKDILREKELLPTEAEVNEKLVEVKKKYPKLTLDEQILATQDILVEEKYEQNLNKLITEAKIEVVE